MLDLVQQMTGCSAHAAQLAWERIVDENATLFAKMTADDINEQKTISGRNVGFAGAFFHDSFDHALADRYERFGAPKCYVCISGPITAYGSSRDFYPLAILSVTVKHNDRAWNCFMLACDVNTLSTDYDVTLMEVWAPMTPNNIPNPDIRGEAGTWNADVVWRKLTLSTAEGPIEWYDENHQYHVTEKGGGAGPGMYYFRKYYD